jgi:hypothetical protein
MKKPELTIGQAINNKYVIGQLIKTSAELDAWLDDENEKSPIGIVTNAGHFKITSEAFIREQRRRYNNQQTFVDRGVFIIVEKDKFEIVDEPMLPEDEEEMFVLPQHETLMSNTNDVYGILGIAVAFNLIMFVLSGVGIGFLYSIPTWAWIAFLSVFFVGNISIYRSYIIAKNK